jgi:molecular chaperone HscB
VPIQDDHFTLFGLPVRFALDPVALEEAYKRVQSQVHPDRFAAGSAAERRIAMQWAARANEAFQTLRSPLKRAAYLCELAGVPIDAESNTAMPPTFLMQQMQWREERDEARDAGDPGRLQALIDEVGTVRDQALHDAETALDHEHDPKSAAALVRQLMFTEKMRDELRELADTLPARAG